MKKISAFTVFIVIIMIVGLALSFPVVAEPIAKAINMPASKLIGFAKFGFMTALGIFLIVSGVASMAVPIVGVSLIIMGLALIAIHSIPFFSKDRPL